MRHNQNLVSEHFTTDWAGHRFILVLVCVGMSSVKDGKFVKFGGLGLVNRIWCITSNVVAV